MNTEPNVDRLFDGSNSMIMGYKSGYIDAGISTNVE